MTRYNDEHWDMEGDFDDMLRDRAVMSYREGVDRVISLMDMETRFQIRSLIEEGEI